MVIRNDMKAKNILLISVGGTIIMGGKSRSKNGVVPIFNGSDLVKMLPSFKKNINLDIYEYGNYPSPQINMNNMFEIRNIILKNLDKYDGFVITHGTDTLEETAYFLDLTLPKKRAVVLTAAMRSVDELGMDGPRNIYSSIRVAASNDGHYHKVMVVLNDDIFDAKTVTKIDTSNISSFSSLYMGILGIVDEDKVVFYRKRYHYEYYDIDSISTNVPLIKLYAGADSTFIDAAINNNADGIVIEALGRGNVPPNVLPGIKRAIEKRIPILIVSRAYQGRVLDVYGYDGGGKQLKKMGCIFGGGLSGQKARIKLTILLAMKIPKEKLTQYFKND